MAIQRIDQVLPCGKAANIRTLTGDILVGANLDAGDTSDGAIASGERYVVSGTGTITYTTPYAVGATFLGGSATAFTRSANTARLIRTEKTAVVVGVLEDAYYIVSGGGNDSVTYSGIEYPPGDVFRGVASSADEFSVSGSAVLYKIGDQTKIETLTKHQIGAVTLPGVNGLDFGTALGVGMSNGAAIPDPNATLNRIYLWNFGTTSATVYFMSFIPNIDNDFGAPRKDSRTIIPGVDDKDKAHAVEWVPTPLHRQGSDNSRFNETDADKALVLSSFVLQTTSKDIWVKPESNTFAGVQ